MWQFLPEQIELSMVAAIRALGPEVLAAGADGPVELDREGVGRKMVHLVFGTDEGGGELPEVVAALVSDPDSRDAREELVHRAFAAFNADPGKVAAANALIAGLYRRRADDGDVDALVELGDFLSWADPEAARAAYQQAIDTGYLPAMFDLARHLQRVSGDHDAALAVYRQAVGAGDQDLAAEALCEIVFLHHDAGDSAAADAALRQVIETGHPVWAAATMIGMAGIQAPDDPAAAEALYRQAMHTGDAQQSADAAVQLGELLEARGDLAGAKAAWQSVIDTADPDWARPAFVSLVNLLRGREDTDGLRAAYQTGRRGTIRRRSTHWTSSARSCTGGATPRAHTRCGSRPSTPATRMPATCASECPQHVSAGAAPRPTATRRACLPRSTRGTWPAPRPRSLTTGCPTCRRH
jgi:TPR repeat protein